MPCKRAVSILNFVIRTMLNPRQIQFVQAYLQSGNATEAYKLAYGITDDNVARANGSRLLTNANVAEAITQFHRKMEKQTGITIEKVVARIARLADRASTDRDKLKALDMLMKHLGGYVTVNDIIERLTAEQLEELSTKIIKRIQSNESSLPQ